jgi:acetyl-CoA synthetase
MQEHRIRHHWRIYDVEAVMSVVVKEQYNIGHICTRQQCERGFGKKIAFRWISAHQERTDFTFNDLDRESNRFANVLQSLGFSSGDILFTFLPKAPEQFFSFLGALKLQVICGTLFSNFGDDALFDRLGDAKAKGIVTKKSFLKKITRVRNQLPYLKYIIVTDIEEHLSADILSYPALMCEASDEFTAAMTTPDTPSVLHYTSGSTGRPKGVLHVHRSILHQSRTAKEVLNLTESDIYWCTADQGWVTGTSYGIIGPWSLGVTQIHYGGGYDAKLWFDLLQNETVTIWYSAPTALRMLMRENAELYKGYNLEALKHIFSVGEPLNPEVIAWAWTTLKKEIYDTWFQTETGGIMITNRPGLEVRPGSMGIPLDDIEPAIIADDGELLGNNKQGNLCLKTGWPSMFATYLNNDSAYNSKLKNGWYYTGDMAVRDDDGYYWFKGRSDDVINTAGHLISPFEVESALLEVEEVAESGVIGAPDNLLYEKVVAFVHLHKQFSWSKELEVKIRLHISNRASSIATPQEIIIVDSIPKNKSGKIMRRVLKARYLGQDAGDISTLED